MIMMDKEHISVDNAVKAQKVNLSNLLQKVKEEEKKKKRINMVVSAAAVSAVTIFGIILTL